ncbi:putative ATPase [Kitasatospora sp. SolWspMP-SS2h]|uniref:AAA family ATPase n=1 Tax=Kitasatospora sp. SolWspMP-SS2h TaxID=1305729 RepID=UPI000DB9B914|nr:AAA family ATPase [Kitasatospora sp. SolWspMP-SS2h]RAJ34565.1 putative ATPase [Kitasatospora sp. SolWspMP-SS2h]
MLTRIEIDGFKSFSNFGLDISPFLVILGPNASGKSNLFDAIQQLRWLVGKPSLFDAFAEARGELGELFRRRGDGSQVPRMSFAVEVLLDPSVADQFGAEVEINHTRLRYELTIEQRGDSDGFVRPFVVKESAIPLRAADDRWVKSHRASQAFRRAHLFYKRQTPLLETVQITETGRSLFKLAQEGRQGRKRELSADAAEATVLSSITSAADFPLLYALRKEIESWRFLQLDPASLRMPSSWQQRGEQLDPSGANLAKVLRRIERRTAGEGYSALDDMAADLTQVIRGFSEVTVEENKAKEQWEVYLTTRDEGKVSARVASDGTLRVLALLATLYDPDYRGLVCFEEPENGIYPQRLRDLVGHLRELVTDPAASELDDGEPLSQLIMSSHSPLLLLTLQKEDIVVMDWVTRPERHNESVRSRVTRVRHLLPDEQHELPLGLVGTVVSEQERRAYPAIYADEARQLLEA